MKKNFTLKDIARISFSRRKTRKMLKPQGLREQGLTGRVFQLRVSSGIGKNYRVGSGSGSGSGIGNIY